MRHLMHQKRKWHDFLIRKCQVNNLKSLKRRVSRVSIIITRPTAIKCRERDVDSFRNFILCNIMTQKQK